jgi:hypothetical protein
MHVESIYEPKLVALWRERLRRFEMGGAAAKSRPDLQVVANQQAPDPLQRGAATENLIALALWLKSESVAASRAASAALDDGSRQKSLDAAARLELACDIVKEHADELRQKRSLSVSQSKTA